MSNSSHDITRLLKRACQGDHDASSKLMTLVYDELRRMASHYMHRERPGHTLNTTALVHEAYLRMVDYKRIRYQDRHHFYAMAAQAMRRVLVDWARHHRAAKRGDGKIKIDLSSAEVMTESQSEDILALNEALDRLQRFDQRQSQIVELRFFGGLTINEVAEILNISPATIKREWSIARAWLYAQIRGTAEP